MLKKAKILCPNVLIGFYVSAVLSAICMVLGFYLTMEQISISKAWMCIIASCLLSTKAIFSWLRMYRYTKQYDSMIYQKSKNKK